ncbi:MAG: putative quinol monooxygenase [Acidimicrobiales bacterium]
MPKVAAIAKITAAPGKRDELVAALRELVTATNDEPGTLVYALHTEKANADAVWFYELYTDDDALAAHSGSPAMKEVGGKLRGLVGGPPEMFVLELAAGKGLPG